MADSLERMISRQFTRWQKLAALAPALLLLAYLPAQVMLRCRIDGILRTECCCSHQNKEQPSGPAVKAQDCCDQELAHSQRPKADVARSASRDLAPTVALAVLLPSAPVVLPPIVRMDWASQRHGPAREGPPLVLLKHAFLI
jgi:hypothetical protein